MNNTKQFTKALKSLLVQYGIIKAKESSNEEQMISYEVVYEPDTLDAHGEWMSKETLTKACEDFNKHLASGDVHANLFHVQDTELFSIEDTWIQKELDVVVPQTGQPIKAGTWVAKLKYNDEDLWNLKKSGVLGGVSIGAKGEINPETGEITNVSFADEETE